MFDVTLDETYRVLSEGTSEGTQDKYYKDGFWYKKDRFGGEGRAESLASLVLESSNLQKDEYVTYEMGKINGDNGCRSSHFLRKGENLITIYRLHQRVYGNSIEEMVMDLSPEERAGYVLDFVLKQTGLDLHTYMANTFFLDYFILNEDRHFNNLSVIYSVRDGFRQAPIFDNGKSLLVGNYSKKMSTPIAENVKKVVARPFCGSHQWQESFFHEWCRLKVDYGLLLEKLNLVEDSYEKEVLLYQANLLRNR